MDAGAGHPDRKEQLLGDLAEGMAMLGKEAQRRAMETEDNDEFVRLSGALCKLARGVRQCLGLHAKLEGDRRKAEREAQADAPEPEPPPADREALARSRRKGQVRRAVERVLWEEYDGEDANEEAFADSLLDDLDDRLAELDEAGDLMAADPDSLIEGLCRELGLDPPPPRPRLRLEPPASPDPAGSAGVEGASRLNGARNVHSPDSS